MFPSAQPRTLAVSGAALPSHNDHPILSPIRLCGTETVRELFDYTLELKTPEELFFSPSIAASRQHGPAYQTLRFEPLGGPKVDARAFQIKADAAPAAYQTIWNNPDFDTCAQQHSKDMP
jgi:hypothetical protein